MAAPVHEWSSLQGKTALVTGAAKRIGRGLAEALAAEGANVVVHYRSARHEAEETVAVLTALGVRAWALEAFLGAPGEVESLWTRACALAGPIDILVNNASEFPETQLASLSLDAVAGDLAVNAFAPLVLSRLLAAQGRSGCIVNMLDTRIVDNDPLHAAYHLSKRTLFTLTRMTAVEYAPLVRVNAVAPGLILPPPGRDMAYLESLASTNPLNRVGSPEEIAEAVMFLVKAPFVTGQVLFVDGGRHLKGNMYGC